MDMRQKLSSTPFFGDGKSGETNWKKGQYIGGGSFGKVYQVLVETSDCDVELAVKEIPIYDVFKKKNDSESLDKEVTAHKNLSHERIIQYYGFCSSETTFHIFIEYMPLGTLSTFIYNNGVDERKARAFTKQILEGVAYLHGRGLFHRDIKSSNVLMLDEENIKLADFGLTREFEEITKTYTMNTGTTRFMAPELIKNKRYNKSVDIWSVGCVVLHMLTGKFPFSNMEQQQAHFHLGQAEDPSPAKDILTELPECSTAFLNRTFQINPSQRPTAESLLADPFITGIGPRQLFSVALFGRSKKGISASGNSIIGEKVFQSSTYDSRTVSTVFKCTTRFKDCQINVVDIPGIGVDGTPDEVLETFHKYMTEAFGLCEDGFSALIFVCRYGFMFTQKDIEIFEILKVLLGSDVVQNSVILLFTHGDYSEADFIKSGLDFASWCRQQRVYMQNLFKECGNRLVLFNNKSGDESSQMDQIKKIIDLTKQTRKYTKNDFIAARPWREQKIRERVWKNTQEFIKEMRSKIDHAETTFEKNSSSLINSLKNIFTALREKEGTILRMNIRFMTNNNPFDLIFDLKKEIKSKIKQLDQLPNMQGKYNNRHN